MLPRWDLNCLADLELNNPSNSSYANGVATYFKKQKAEGWKDFIPKKPRKIKLKEPNPFGRKKFRLVPHEPEVLTTISKPPKIAECLQHATEWYYNAGLGHVAIKFLNAPDMIIVDPLMMYQFCERDARRLMNLPFCDLMNMKREAKPFFHYLQDNIDTYNCNRMAEALNALKRKKSI